MARKEIKAEFKLDTREAQKAKKQEEKEFEKSEARKFKIAKKRLEARAKAWKKHASELKKMADQAAREAAARAEKWKKRWVSAGHSIAKVFRNTVAVIGAALTATAKVSLDAFQKQQDAVNNLRAALQDTGSSMPKLTKEFTEFASAMQKQTKHGDVAILQAITFGKNIGINTGQLKEATKAAIGLAAKFNKDLPTAMRLVALAAKGETGQLKEMGIVIDTTLSAQEKFTALVKMGTDAFHLAEAETKTVSGAIAQLKEVWGDALEKIGEAISDAGLGDWLQSVKKRIQELAESGALQRWADNVVEALLSAKDTISEVAAFFGGAATGGMNPFKALQAGAARLAEQQVENEQAAMIRKARRETRRKERVKGGPEAPTPTATAAEAGVVAEENVKKELAARKKLFEQAKKHVTELKRGHSEELKAARDAMRVAKEKLAIAQQELAVRRRAFLDPAFRKQQEEERKASEREERRINRVLEGMGLDPLGQKTETGVELGGTDPRTKRGRRLGEGDPNRGFGGPRLTADQRRAQAVAEERQKAAEAQEQIEQAKALEQDANKAMVASSATLTEINAHLTNIEEQLKPEEG
jgi:hypothetical protein